METQNTNKMCIVIGSWGSYNACNERALGSSWLDLDDFTDWEEVVAELEKQGFELDGVDEELFIQDIEGIECSAINWDYMSPKHLFEVIKDSGVLEYDSRYEAMQAFLEIENFDEFMRLVDEHGENWDNGIHVYKGFDWSDYGEEMFDSLENGSEISENLRQFIDFEAYGKHMGDYYCHEYSGGLIEIII